MPNSVQSLYNKHVIFKNVTDAINILFLTGSEAIEEPRNPYTTRIMM